jgi:hypothetical protein
MTQATNAKTGGVVVTGLPRSGTSWAGKMLAASGELVYVNEPLNPAHPPGRSPGVLNADVTHRFQYICPGNDQRWAAAFADTLRLRYHVLAELRRNRGPYDLARMVKYLGAFTGGRVQGRRALIDDPYAVLSSGWFASRLGCQVVVMVRHPVALVGAWRRLGWEADLGDLLGQPLLMRDLFGPYAEQLAETAAAGDPIEAIAQLWRVTYAAVGELADQAGPAIRVQRYEDLATEPGTAFPELYRACRLTWTPTSQARVITATTGTGTPERTYAWSLLGGLSRTAFRSMDSKASLRSYRDRLTEKEIAKVTELTADVAKRFYDLGEAP